MDSPFFEFLHLADWENDTATVMLMNEVHQLKEDSINALTLVNVAMDPHAITRFQAKITMCDFILGWSKQKQEEIDKKEQAK